MSHSMPPLSLEPSAASLLPADITGGSGRAPVIAAGRYALGGVIGVGTYGEVRAAVSLQSGERVAIKIVDLARFSADTAGLMRKEISILRLLGSHPHCIRIIDVHEQVPLAGRWCDACACTSFKYPVNSSAPLSSTSPCGVCSHAAAEHSGVAYHPGGAFADPAHSAADDEDEGEVREVMLIVQELASGGELFSLLSHTGPLPEDVARLYFQQLCAGMAHIHALNVAHRDLKPENLVFAENFQLKIADFGLASLGTPVAATAGHAATPAHATHDPTNTTLRYTQEQHLQAAAHNPADPVTAKEAGLVDVRHYSGVGSQPYSAPECLYVRELYGGRGYRGAPCDVWSSAVILFVMLTGRPPFVRPLSKTYGTHLRRCRHFVAMQSGQGMDMLSPHAKDLLQHMLRLAPDERLTLSQIACHPWVLGPTPSPEVLNKIMEERAQRSWEGSGAPEMNHVLSEMRNSKLGQGDGGLNSQTGTPQFGAMHSPALEPRTALNSPSFSASSIPPSPYATAHTQAGGAPRACTPESRRYSNASPAYPHGRSALLSPNVPTHTHASSFLPPPPQLAHRASIAGSTVEPTPVHAAQSIASSINSAGALPLASTLEQMSLLDAESHSEIPPPAPDASPAASGDAVVAPPRTLEEAQQEELIQQKIAAAAAQAAQQREEDAAIARKTAAAAGAHQQSSPIRRKRTLTRYESTPELPNAGAATGVEPVLPMLPLALASSLSYPPQCVSAAHCVSALEYSSLLSLLQARLEARGARFKVLPPRGRHAAAAAAGASDATAAALLDGGEEEYLMHVTASFRGASIIALLSIRSFRSNVMLQKHSPAHAAACAHGAGAAGAKQQHHPAHSRGHSPPSPPHAKARARDSKQQAPQKSLGFLVLAESVRARDAAAFHAWFKCIARGLREE